MRSVLAAACLAVLPIVGLAEPRFEQVDIAAHEYTGGWEHFVGGGLAGFDCDGDTLPELFAAGGENPAALFRNTSKPGGTVSFVKETPESLAITGVTGAYPLEIDGDGVTDLVVLRVGENSLLQGLGECHFAPFPDLKLPASDRWTTAFSATWEAGNRLPTLAFGNYVDRSNPDGPFEACDRNELFRPTGNGYGDPMPLEPGFCALSMLFSDWGRHGRADLRVSNDRHYYVRDGEEQMWAMETDPRLLTARDGWRSYSIWGMGIGSRDMNGDGLPDVYLTSMADQKFQYLAGHEAPEFVDAPYAAGTTAHRPYTGGDGRPSTGWHVALGDVQNDGLDDMFVTKGNVDQMPGSAMDDPNNLLLQLPNGGFAEAGDSAGVASFARGRGAAMADFNADGLLDIAVMNRRAAMEVYRNVTEPEGTWIGILPRQAISNTDAIGSWIEIDTGDRMIVREVTVGGGHAGGTLGPQHFGLGDSTQVKLRVIWPDGATSAWQGLEAGKTYVVARVGNDFDTLPY